MIYRFSGFAFDADRYELTRDGEPVDAEPQVLEVLALLLRHRDRLVTKEELLAEVWEGRFVGDSALSRAIREVRKALGDRGAESRFVKTVYGRGFRFVGEGVEVGDGVEVREAETAEARGSGARPIPAPLTPLIGRERELDDVRGLLETARLLTLTGAAGTGKTRLAVEVARQVAGRFADGAVFVPLADVEAGEDPAAALARALVRALDLSDAVGASTFGALALQLRDRRQLLVLDSFEHLADAAPALAELLGACPGLAALVTSRFVLRLPGEQEYPLAPLALPARDAPAEALRDSPAVALFLARARAALPSFQPRDEELGYVAEICRRLDGLPLALELSAALVKVFSPEALWERLAGRLDLLSSRTTASHAAVPGTRGRSGRTLAKAHAWSYDLLDADERSLLRRLVVFSGGFRLDAVEAVCGLAPESAVELLSALVDKSLVERREERSGAARFFLLETTREFALARLREEEGDAVALRRAHAAWALALSRQGAAALEGGDQKRWLDRLDAEYPNLLGALQWGRDARSGSDLVPTEGDLARAIETGAALGRYWSARAAYREGRSELASLLDPERPGASSVPAAVRAEGLIALGLLTHLLCRYREAEERLNEARALLERIGDRARLAPVLNHLAWVALQIAPMERAESLAREGLRANEERGDLRGTAVALHNLGHIEVYRGNPARAEELFRASLELRRRIGDDRGVAFTLANLSMARLLLTDDLDDVGGWLREAEALVARLDDRPLLGWITCLRARLDLLLGELDRALERLGEPVFETSAAAHPEAAAWLHLFTGDVLRARGDGERARIEHERTHELWRSIECHWGEVTAALRLAEVADAETARALRHRALELAERHGLDGMARAIRASA